MAHTLFCVVPIIFELSSGTRHNFVKQRHADFEIFDASSLRGIITFSLESAQVRELELREFANSWYVWYHGTRGIIIVEYSTLLYYYPLQASAGVRV